MHLTTLDAKPNEWMAGDAAIVHTVTACTFESIDHAQHCIDAIVPKNRAGKYLKWSEGRRKERTRAQFVENCLANVSQLKFKINSVSSSEGNMSWFAWAFYMQNLSLIKQQTDLKGRNCLVFSGIRRDGIAFPVLRAGYLIWYHHVIRYLVEAKGLSGKFLSDNFCADEEGKAIGVGFVNFLLQAVSGHAPISLPLNDRFRALDVLSDNICGWVNDVRIGIADQNLVLALQTLREDSSLFDDVEYAMDLRVVDAEGKDVTAAIKKAVVEGRAEA